MKKYVLVSLVFAFTLASGLFAAESKTEKTFTGEAATIKTQLEALFDASRKVNSTPAEKKVARETIENAMEWDQIAKDCLGNKEWNSTAVANRNAYRDLLKDVVVRTAYTRLDKFWNGATFKFTKIDVKDAKAQVTAKYTVKADDFSLDYYMMKKDGHWMVYDVAFDDIRYSENIREQITAFLKEKGFANLLDKLKKRRQELEEGTKAKKAQAPSPTKKT